ncbi:hypothetical protein WKK05_15435 [Nostoc sp. UHCC 0302]|uniref:hypothetical protein n=1 Tax=Nostoc sp. UHCC 0302 TaxID=3134896 RepID=UPI00311CC1F3
MKVVNNILDLTKLDSYKFKEANIVLKATFIIELGDRSSHILHLYVEAQIKSKDAPQGYLIFISFYG